VPPTCLLLTQSGHRAARRPIPKEVSLALVPFKVGSWPAAKTLAKIKKTAVSALRSLPVDIVLAIEAVQRAGLTVYGGEITLAGAINISTQPTLPSVSKRPTTLRQVTETDLVDETTPSKKLV
jgi:hypothetical protein